MGSRILGLWISIWLGLKLKLNPTGAGAILFISEFFQQKRFVFLIVLSYDVNFDLRFGFYGANQRFEDRNSSISSKKEHSRRKNILEERTFSKKGSIHFGEFLFSVSKRKKIFTLSDGLTQTKNLMRWCVANLPAYDFSYSIWITLIGPWTWHLNRSMALFLLKTLISWFTRDPNEKVSKKLFAFYTEDDVEAEDIKTEEIKAEESHLMS